MSDLLESGTLLLALLNPFLLIVYLVGPMHSLDSRQFTSVIFRAGVIASTIFCIFAVLGDAIFTTVLKANFASFQIFGGIIFILIGVQFVFKGPKAVELLRGEPAQISGAIAMPVLIGPGTISASVIIGKRHDALSAGLTVIAAVFISLLIVIMLKGLHDYVRPRNEALVERYIDIVGRITALYIGTIAVEMIMTGIGHWVEKFQ